MDTIQTDSVIFSILAGAAALLNVTGGIYTAGERPENSDREDIVVSTISFEHTTPKRGVSNINIHVPDIAVDIDGIPQFKTDRDRLQELAAAVFAIIESTTIEGVGIHIDTSQVFAEQTAHEHYINIRCSWLIAKPFTTDIDIKENPFAKKIAVLEQRVRDLETANEELKAKIEELTAQTIDTPTEPGEPDNPDNPDNENE